MTTLLWQPLNVWATTWAGYMWGALVDASVGLVLVLAIWSVVHRRVPARWCYLLFLLVPLKMLIPLQLPVLPALTTDRPEVIPAAVDIDVTALARAASAGEQVQTTTPHVAQPPWRRVGAVDGPSREIAHPSRRFRLC